MPVVKLTKRTIDAIRPAVRPTIYYDDELTGFGSGSRHVEQKAGSSNIGPAFAPKLPKRRMVLGRAAYLDA